MSYLIWAGITVCAGFLLFGGLLKRKGLPVRTAAISLPLSIILGFVFAKVFYVVFMQAEDVLTWGEWERFLDFQPRRMCFVCGAAGACLGVWLAARWTGQDRKKVMDCFAAPGALLVAGFRLAECTQGTLGLGVLAEGSGWLSGPPFVMTDAYGDPYVAVFFWEAVAALVIGVFALIRKEERDGHRFEKTVYCLCLCQILLESMRNHSMRWGFVCVEMLLCAVIMVALSFMACRRNEKRTGRYRPVGIQLMGMGDIVAVEFARQKAGIEFLADYGYWMMAAVLLYMGFDYFRTLKENRTA